MRQYRGDPQRLHLLFGIKIRIFIIVGSPAAHPHVGAVRCEGLQSAKNICLSVSEVIIEITRKFCESRKRIVHAHDLWRHGGTWVRTLTQRVRSFVHTVY